MQPKTNELLGLVLAGTCLGFLLPFWVPDVVGAILEQATIVARTIRNLTIDQYVGIGFWLGTLLLVKGFVGRWRRRHIGGER